MKSLLVKLIWGPFNGGKSTKLCVNSAPVFSGSAHAGNMMVESGARTLLSLLQRGARGRQATSSEGPTVRRQSRTREKTSEGMLSRGSSRGPARDKSVSPTRELGARRRGASVEPTMNRNRMDMRRANRNKAPAFALEPVQE